MPKVNNETLGISAEYSMCQIYDIPNTINTSRVHKGMVNNLKNIFEQMKDENPHIKINKHIGGENKSTDFIFNDDLTLSLKTNKSKSGPKVCPQNIGQPTKQRFCEINKLNLDSSNTEIKDYIITNIETLIKKYYNNLFCCDLLLWIYKNKKNKYEYKLLKKEDYPFNESNFSFTRYINEEDIDVSKTKQKWNDSTTVKYNNISIGEFQVHTTRNCIKFRFLIRNLLQFFK